MLKRTWSLLLLVALSAAPATAFAAAPDRATPDRGPSLIERLWDGLVRFIDIDGDDSRDRTREPELPRSVSGADDAGGQVDPDG